MKTRGRPKKNLSRDKIFNLRMTNEEMSILQFLSGEMGLSKSEVIRKILYIYHEMYIRKR